MNNYLHHSVDPTSIRRRSAETGRRSPSMQRKFQRYATQIKMDTDCATSHLPLNNFSSTSPYFIYIKVPLPQAASVLEAINIAWRGCSKRSFFIYLAVLVPSAVGLLLCARRWPLSFHCCDIWLWPFIVCLDLFRFEYCLAIPDIAIPDIFSWTARRSRIHLSILSTCGAKILCEYLWVLWLLDCGCVSDFSSLFFVVSDYRSLTSPFRCWIENAWWRVKIACNSHSLPSI